MDAKAALEAGLIDKIFYNRYQRMLTIFKLVITPIIRGELLKNLFMKAFDDFVWDITYEHWTLGGQGRHRQDGGGHGGGVRADEDLP